MKAEKERKARKFEVLLHALFGTEEYQVYRNMDSKNKRDYNSNFHRQKEKGVIKKEKPSEFLSRIEKGLRINDKVGMIVDSKFGIEEVKYYKSLEVKDRQAYSSYVLQRLKANKSFFSPSEWKMSSQSEKRSDYKKRDYIKYKQFTAYIKEVFCESESLYFKDMIDFAKKAYRDYFRMCPDKSNVKKPSEWYESFIISTNCAEMIKLQNKFFAMIKLHITEEEAMDFLYPTHF